ncbi:hypothetical protein L207DRAFT_536492 [Hyaloscypha variabilis F]|uniref:Uncharacterized protein n=1 Tax=Hyaloscypha variabilis (strain UAMH 11265 / GT02V1 / F) TaxID=1149755 RepID=A0A2J6R0M9_HYAVF|nr:hypothetical protein L207DRAFT_536492 [Hyaloscypha variabilis F]
MASQAQHPHLPLPDYFSKFASIYISAYPISPDSVIHDTAATSSYPARASYVCNDRGLCWLVKSTPQAIIHISNNPISIRCTKNKEMPVNATPIVPQTQPASDSEHEWSCAQARSASSTRDEYARAWYRKLIFLHFSLILEVIAFVAYVAAMPTRYQWGISAFLGILETSFIGMFVIPALVFSPAAFF